MKRSLVLMLIGFVFGAAAEAKTIFVKSDATGANNGTSWTDAFTSLQSALEDSASSDEIWVANTGSYKPSVPSGRSATFTMKSGVSLFGGFQGTESTKGDRPSGTRTILSGDIGVLNRWWDNVYHVVTCSTSAYMERFVVCWGYADGSYGNSYGGGIYNVGFSSLVLEDCVLSSNYADIGGGMHATSAVTISNCRFVYNGGNTAGGALSIVGIDNMTIENCIFELNNSYDQGGALFFSFPGKTLTLNNCFFENHWVSMNGGAIYGNAGILNLQECYIGDNFAGYYYNGDPMVMGGGGIWSAGKVIAKDTVFYNNAMVDGRGGAIYASNCDLDRCWFESNYATEEYISGSGSGGAIYLFSPGTGNITNTAFVDNQAYANGAAILFGTNSTINMVVSGCTFVDNLSPDYAVGLLGYTSGITINNSIFWDNICTAAIEPSSFVVNYSNVEDGWGGSGTGNIDQNPLLNSVLVPQSGSPCIDAGNNNLIPSGSEIYDLNGMTRIVNSTVDMGAVEVQ